MQQAFCFNRTSVKAQCYLILIIADSTYSVYRASDNDMVLLSLHLLGYLPNASHSVRRLKGTRISVGTEVRSQCQTASATHAALVR
eukprot:6589396-Prymnesium_polylepis.1